MVQIFPIIEFIFQTYFATEAISSFLIISERRSDTRGWFVFVVARSTTFQAMTARVEMA